MSSSSGKSPRYLIVVAALACLALVGPGVATAVKTAPERAPKPTLSLKVSRVLERQIRAVGKVRPVPGRGRVVLQLRRGGGWRRLGRAVPVRRRGSYAIRAVVPAGIADARLRAALYEGKRRTAVSAVRSLKLQKPTSPSTPTGPPIAANPPTPAPNPSGPPASLEEDVPCTTPATVSPPPASGDPLAAGSLTSTIDRYASLPNHLSGTANGAAAESQFAGALAAAGLPVCEQAFTYPRFAPTAVGLAVAGSSPISSGAIAPLLYSGATPAGGVTAQLFYAGEGKKEVDATFTKTQVEGRIVVARIPYQTNSKALGLDPAIEKAVEYGAVGFVAVTRAVGDYPKWEDTNARRGTGTLPTVMVGKDSGEGVIAAAKVGGSATLTLAADHTGVACERDVWGELEGADPNRRIYVGVPVTSYTPSASEHGTGYAIAIGLARHYASLPRSARPASLVFIALGGHEIGWLGLQALLASRYGDRLREADGYVHLGSALGAPEAEEDAEGSIVTGPGPDPTGRLHESENPLLVPGVEEDFAAAGIPTKETPPATASGGEQTNAFAAGIPTASFSGASLYFHTAGDVPGTIDDSILERQADAFRRVVDRIEAVPAGQLRAQNGVAAQHGAELEASDEAARRTPANPTLGASRGNLGPNALAEGGVGGPPATPVATCPG